MTVKVWHHSAIEPEPVEVSLALSSFNSGTSGRQLGPGDDAASLVARLIYCIDRCQQLPPFLN